MVSLISRMPGLPRLLDGVCHQEQLQIRADILRTIAKLMLAVTLSLSDDDFGKLVAGKTQAQRLFMSGKLKVKGNVMKATKMEPILKKAQMGIKAKL